MAHVYIGFILNLDGENPLLLSATNIEEKNLLNQFYQPRTFLLTLASDFTLKYLDRFTRLTDKKMKGKSGNNNALWVDVVIEEDNSLVSNIEYRVNIGY